MTNQTPKVLDLQEIFGQANSVQVKTRDGKLHHLLRMEAISPKEAVLFQQLQLKANRLQHVSRDMTDGQATELTAIFDQLLSILCKDLKLDEMLFMEKISIIQFYMEQTQGKKAMELALRKVRQTGARHSRK